MLCNFLELFNAAKKESDIIYKLYPYIIQLFLLWSGNYYYEWLTKPSNKTRKNLRYAALINLFVSSFYYLVVFILVITNNDAKEYYQFNDSKI
jgi:hypothetical protein